MFFTHADAITRRAVFPNASRHAFADVVLAEDRIWARRVRSNYIVLRRRGFTPSQARGVLWDVAMAANAKCGDHDVMGRPRASEV